MSGAAFKAAAPCDTITIKVAMSSQKSTGTHVYCLRLALPAREATSAPPYSINAHMYAANANTYRRAHYCLCFVGLSPPESPKLSPTNICPSKSTAGSKYTPQTLSTMRSNAGKKKKTYTLQTECSVQNSIRWWWWWWWRQRPCGATYTRTPDFGNPRRRASLASDVRDRQETSLVHARLSHADGMTIHNPHASKTACFLSLTSKPMSFLSFLDISRLFL